jgi:hypothetical protein
MIGDYQSDKIACDEAEVDVPHIFTEFGLFYCRRKRRCYLSNFISETTK